MHVQKLEYSKLNTYGLEWFGLSFCFNYVNYSLYIHSLSTAYPVQDHGGAGSCEVGLQVASSSQGWFIQLQSNILTEMCFIFFQFIWYQFISTRGTAGSDIWCMCLAEGPTVQSYHLRDYEWMPLSQNPGKKLYLVLIFRSTQTQALNNVTCAEWQRSFNRYFGFIIVPWKKECCIVHPYLCQ